jgi:hypothetical protein
LTLPDERTFKQQFAVFRIAELPDHHQHVRAVDDFIGDGSLFNRQFFVSRIFGNKTARWPDNDERGRS